MPPTDPDNTIHEQWMHRCLELARRGYGHASPNPLVGSVLVGESGEVLGEGWHKAYGGHHAERNAILDAESKHNAEALRHATLYVNLEPCSHYGKTPPCAKLVLEKEIPRVVVGMIDPNKKVSGRGIKLLRDAGVEVSVDVLKAACERLNEAFSHHTKTGRPLVSLKVAQTLDGRIATLNGDSQWVSGEAARTLVHEWRARLDAVLVGSGTALSDNPSLTVRHVSGRQPYRVILDRAGQLPPHLQVFSDDFVNKTIAIVGTSAEPMYAPQLKEAGGQLLCLPEKNGHLDLSAVFYELGKSTDSRKGFQSVLVEAGPGLATALFEQDLVDQLNLFIAPKLIGQGLPTLDGLSIAKMSEAKKFAMSTWTQVGEDMLFRGRKVYRGQKVCGLESR